MSDLSRYEEVSSELAFTSEVIAKQLAELKQVSNELNKVDIGAIKNAVSIYNEAIKSPVTNELKSYVEQMLNFVKQAVEPRLNAIDNTRERLESLNSGFNLTLSNYKVMAISAILSLLFGACVGGMLSYEWLIKGEKRELNDKLAAIEANYPSINEAYKLLAKKGIKLESAQDSNSIYVVVPNQKGEAYTAKDGNLVIKISTK